MPWKFSQDKPIYQQIINYITLGILSGEYGLGERLSSVRELAAIAGVNPNTMQKALQEMERIGLVSTQRTSGKFITNDKEIVNNLRKNIAKERIEEFVYELMRMGYSLDDIVQLIKQVEIKENK